MSARTRITNQNWGKPPWRVGFRPRKRRLPGTVEFAIVGGGFSGLAAAAWLRHLAPGKSVAIFEATRIGAGSSGHTGGIALGETAAGELPGLGEVLGGVRRILRTLRVNCDFETGGVYELSHRSGMADSPIRWADSGELRVAKEVAGGSVDPGKMLGGLARAAERLGAMIFEDARVESIDQGRPLRLYVRGGEIPAHRTLVATNAMSLELGGLAERAEPKFTLAVETEPLTAAQLSALGLDGRSPFYTVDLPYLWGRLRSNSRVIFGSGLVHLNDWRELERISIEDGEAAELLGRLCARVRGLHPALRGVKFTRRWGGPMLVGPGWKPVFARHGRTGDLLVLGAYSGHGVALSVYLGCWAAEVMLGRKKMPNWGARGERGSGTA